MKTFAIALFMSLSLYANVDFLSTITDVNYRGTFEKTGSIRLLINGDDLPASMTLPIYLRVRLSSGATLAKTLVGTPNGSDNAQPILLAVSLFGDQSGAQVNLPPDAVSLVRFIKGENAFWLKLNFHTDQVVLVNAEPMPLNPNLALSFLVGVTGQESLERNESAFAMGYANLPANQLNENPADTRLFVDLSKSVLEPSPSPQSLLEFDPIFFDHQSQNVESAFTVSGIKPGAITATVLTGDTAIARAVTPSAPVTLTDTVEHVAAGSGRFSTFLALNNLSQATSVTLRGYDSFGVIRDEVELELAAERVTRVQLDQVFGNQDFAFLKLDRPESVQLTYGYEGKDGMSASSPFSPNAPQGLNFLVTPSHVASVFDGLVVTGYHAVGLSFQIEFLDGAGDLISNSLITDPAKKVVLSLSDDPNYAQSELIRITSNDPITLVHLRRLILAGGTEYLFPVQPQLMP
ncbi:MAG: hypothetical protein H6510_10385 [Acidobacteria bacterium]|nr:hypothetical protein [Acidobacteriota bacterium]